MTNRKIIDIEPRAKTNSQENDFYEDLPKINPPKKKKRKDILITVLIIMTAFLVASIITKYSSQIQPNIKSNNSSADSPLKFTHDSGISKNSTPKTDTKEMSDPFKPLSIDSIKEVATADEPVENTIVKNSFKIRILNGNGITGDAAKIKTDLAAKGYDVGTIGNAKLKYALTEVYYLASYKDQADMVAKDLSPRKTEIKEAEAGLIGSNYNILVVIGKE